MLCDCCSLGAEDEEEKCRVIVERRDVGAIESAGMVRGELKVARVLLLWPRICRTEGRARDVVARKLIRDDWMERESMERYGRGGGEELYTG
jgi:hypothetical protein